MQTYVEDAKMAQRFTGPPAPGPAVPPQQRYPPPPVPPLRQYAGPTFPVSILVYAN